MTVADSVLNYVANNRDKEFARKDIQLSDYCKNFVRMIFGKPDTDNPSAEREYNKFFGQPLQSLYHAHILNATKRGNTWHYSINNYELLEYIATKEVFAFNFLYLYLEKFLGNSGFIRHIHNYKNLCENGSVSSSDFSDLRNRWDAFLLGNTPKESKTESHRIWPKVLNIFAVKYQINGTVLGKISNYNFTFNDLLYNRLNWRDIDKDKKLTRKEAEAVERGPIAENYRIQKAIGIIQKKYSQSELKDQWARGAALCVHHIFPKQEFPEISTYLENLIKLTVQQHMEKAHPNHNTRQIDKNYQLDCLLAKSQSIEESIGIGEFLYSINDFLYVINTGLNANYSNDLTFDKIRSKLIEDWSLTA